MRAAAILSFFVALILIGTALSGWYDEEQGSSEHISEEFRQLERRDYTALDQSIAQSREREHVQALEAIGGVMFLIAGLVLWSKRPLKAMR
jgi:hypothetical protein